MITGDKKSPKSVLVGVTGRVDSVVAAFLLKKQGFNVTALAMIKNDSSIVPSSEFLPKCHLDKLDTIQLIMDKMGIPFYATNIMSEFDEVVIDKMMTHKILAKANRSCFDCVNLRFKTLYTKMKTLNMDFMATGHYAKVSKNHTTGASFISPNACDKSDQSFLLSTLDSSLLSRLILPLGDLKKDEASKIAKKFNLKTLDSRSISGFCFRDKESVKKLINQRVPESLNPPGTVRNLLTDSNVAEHEGICFHYISEDELEFKKSTIDKKLKIIGYNFKDKIIDIGDDSVLKSKGVKLINTSFSTYIDRSKPLICYVKYKYSNTAIKSELYFKNSDTAYLEFSKQLSPLILGEVLAFYDREGSGAKIIGSAEISGLGVFEDINRVKKFEVKDDDSKDDLKPYNYWSF